MTVRTAVALATIYANRADAIARRGWRTDFTLQMDGATYAKPFLVRVPKDKAMSAGVPWSVVTEDDSLADDWVAFKDGKELSADAYVTPSEQSYFHAFDQLVGGKTPAMVMANGLKVTLEAHAPFGKVLVLNLPSGEKKIFRPAPQNLTEAWSVLL